MYYQPNLWHEEFSTEKENLAGSEDEKEKRMEVADVKNF